MSVLAVFGSHYSLPANGGLLTLEEPGKAKPGSPVSVFDCAKQGRLKEVVLVDEHPDGLVQAWKTAQKCGVKLCFGLKLVVCADATDKSEASLATESKVIVFARVGEPNAQSIAKGYSDLVRVWNRASTTGHYYQARTSWAWLKEQWTDNLLLALPFFSSFIAKNTLTFNRIVPDLPCAPWVFREVASELPFAPLIDKAIDRYLKDNAAQVQETKTVYYRSKADFEAYQVMRAIGGRGATFAAPSVDHLSSDAFSFESYLSLCPPPTLPAMA